MTKKALKMPVKTARIVLNDDSDYAGFEFMARTNFSLGVAEDLVDGDFDRKIACLMTIIQEWNFVDEEGKPLGAPSDRDAMRQIPIELVTEITAAITAEVTDDPKP